MAHLSCTDVQVNTATKEQQRQEQDPPNLQPKGTRKRAAAGTDRPPCPRRSHVRSRKAGSQGVRGTCAAGSAGAGGTGAQGQDRAEGAADSASQPNPAAGQGLISPSPLTSKLAACVNKLMTKLLGDGLGAVSAQEVALVMEGLRTHGTPAAVAFSEALDRLFSYGATLPQDVALSLSRLTFTWIIQTWYPECALL
jgi:hypothetical protein